MGDGDLVADGLCRLRVVAGNPSLQKISNRIISNGRPTASRGYLSQVFSGGRVPSEQMAEAIAVALGATVAEVERVKRLAADVADVRREPHARPTDSTVASTPTWFRSGYLHHVRSLAPRDDCAIARPRSPSCTRFVQAMRHTSGGRVSPGLVSRR